MPLTIENMQTFETKYIGNDLFEVSIDGVKSPVPYTMEQVGELYAMNWSPIGKENKDEGDNVQG